MIEDGLRAGSWPRSRRRSRDRPPTGRRARGGARGRRAADAGDRLRALSRRSSSPRTARRAPRARSATEGASRQSSGTRSRTSASAALDGLRRTPQGRRRGRAHDALFTLADAIAARVEAAKARRRRARFRRPHRQDARAALARRRRLGALQARPRHRPRPRRRGAGHQPRAVGDPAPHHRGFLRPARGAARPVRTLFAVGDPKQSIYGFQGAAPREFETSRAALATARPRAPDCASRTCG